LFNLYYWQNTSKIFVFLRKKQFPIHNNSAHIIAGANATGNQTLRGDRTNEIIGS
jgi:hypothetical protein